MLSDKKKKNYPELFFFLSLHNEPSDSSNNLQTILDLLPPASS